MRVTCRACGLGCTMLLALYACSGDGPTQPTDHLPATVTLSVTAVSLTSLGETRQLVATVQDQGGRDLNVPVSWTTADGGVASVDAAGVVLAVGNGNTVVTAKAASVSGTANVTVLQAVATLVVTPETVAFDALGATQALAVAAADARDNPVQGPAVTWTSSAPVVMSVSDEGVASAVGEGSATITASSGDVTATVEGSVLQAPVEIRVTPESAEVNAGSTVTFEAVLVDSGGSPISRPTLVPEWSSDDPSVAMVSADGTVSGVAPGSTRIVVVVDTFSAFAEVTVGDDGGDLGVGWIHRSPEMDFVWASTNPTRDGWPAEGQSVTWEATTKNWSAFDRIGVTYRWTLDGVELATGSVDMPAGQYVKVELTRPWSFTRERLGFEIDPDDQVEEVEERNNTLEVFTDALSVGFYVEQSVYDYFARNQSKLGIGSNSWEDWAQRHFRIWNQMFADAVYPLTPNGVLDRLRLDKITIVLDGTLPLAGGLPTNHPNLNDRTVDLQWGFPASLFEWAYKDLTTIPDATGRPENFFYFEGSLLHELGHARYLGHPSQDVDDGQWVGPPADSVENRGSRVAIFEDGEPIAGSKYMPFINWNQAYPGWCEHPWPGLMSGREKCNPDGSVLLDQYRFVDEHSAVALNLIAGHRATLGNVNASGNGGVYYRDLPADVRLTVTDLSGNALAGATLTLFRFDPSQNRWDGVADGVYATDGSGEASFRIQPMEGGWSVDGDRPRGIPGGGGLHLPGFLLLQHGVLGREHSHRTAHRGRAPVLVVA